jgi:glycosyltransferase involved in cell wall biosynthesis
MAAKLLFFVTEDWYFCSHRLPLAVAARKAGYDVGVITRVRKHGDLIRQSGLRLIPFELSRSGMNPFVDLATILQLVKVYRREQPDIVHHVAIKPVLYGSLAARLTGIKHIVNAMAGMGWLFASSGMRVDVLKGLVRRALRVLLSRGITLVQNPDDVATLTHMGVSPQRIRMIHGSGVDLDKFHPVSEPDGVPVVVLPARLLWDKGVGEFVEAARLLKSRGIEARFVLAGAPDPANPASVASEQIDKWVSEGVVDHVGWHENMPTLLAQSNIVCLPSYYREGVPKSLIEAAASGRPMVAADVPGSREVVINNSTGLLVPARDAQALSNALAKLIEDPFLRQQMGQHARQRAEQLFGIEQIVSQTLALYRQVELT